MEREKRRELDLYYDYAGDNFYKIKNEILEDKNNKEQEEINELYSK